MEYSERAFFAVIEDGEVPGLQTLHRLAVRIANLDIDFDDARVAAQAIFARVLKQRRQRSGRGREQTQRSGKTVVVTISNAKTSPAGSLYQRKYQRKCATAMLFFSIVIQGS